MTAWELGHAGRIGYLDAIAELADFRKVNGASDVVLRGLSSTEMSEKGPYNSFQNDAVAMDQ